MALKARIAPLLFVITIFVFISQAGAQTSIEAGGGINLARISGHAGYNRGFLSYQAGLFINRLYTKKINIRTGLVFSRQGGNNETPYRELRSLYLLAPVTVHYKIVPTFSFLSGPQIGIHLRNNRPELEGMVTPLDFSWLFGFQADAGARLTIRVSYSFSANSLGQARGVLEGANRVLQAGLFAKIVNLKK